MFGTLPFTTLDGNGMVVGISQTWEKIYRWTECLPFAGAEERHLSGSGGLDLSVII